MSNIIRYLIKYIYESYLTQSDMLDIFDIFYDVIPVTNLHVTERLAKSILQKQEIIHYKMSRIQNILINYFNYQNSRIRHHLQKSICK